MFIFRNLPNTIIYRKISQLFSLIWSFNNKYFLGLYKLEDSEEKKDRDDLDRKMSGQNFDYHHDNY